MENVVVVFCLLGSLDSRENIIKFGHDKRRVINNKQAILERVVNPTGRNGIRDVWSAPLSGR